MRCSFFLSSLEVPLPTSSCRGGSRGQSPKRNSKPRRLGGGGEPCPTRSGLGQNWAPAETGPEGRRQQALGSLGQGAQRGLYLWVASTQLARPWTGRACQGRRHVWEAWGLGDRQPGHQHCFFHGCVRSRSGTERRCQMVTREARAVFRSEALTPPGARGWVPEKHPRQGPEQETGRIPGCVTQPQMVPTTLSLPKPLPKKTFWF